MKASVGNMLVIRGRHEGEPNRTGEIIEVRGADGSPPYVVRWNEGGHEVLVFPGPDAVVERAVARHRGGGHRAPV